MEIAHNLSAITALAYRDLLKFLRDRPRLISTFIVPFLFILALGGTMQASFGDSIGYNYITFTFTGVYAQTLFLSSSMGILSLMEDRENDFAQEVFVSPISRYSIVLGKIIGESLVAMAQGLGIIIFALVMGVRFTPGQLLLMPPLGAVTCLFGGAFGLALMSSITNRRTADQIFNFVMLPQYFLGGVFTPLTHLPLYLDVISRLAPLRYAVDLTRGLFYAGGDEYTSVVADSPLLNIAVIGVGFALCLVFGTALFVRNERNR